MKRYSLTRRHFLATTLTASIAGSKAIRAAVQDTSLRKPNIIYIMADDLGYADLGCYGQQKIKTPHIDRLAQRGTRFTQVYCGSAVCAPSRNALMTGQHMGHATIRGNHPKVGGIPSPYKEPSTRLPLASKDVTVAQILKNAGYATGITGKWGIGEANTDATPNQKGFDEWLGYLNQDHAVYYWTDMLWRNRQKRHIPENQDNKQGKYTPHLFTDFAIDFIAYHKDHPFFLYLAFTIPHAEIVVPDLGPYAEKTWPESQKTYAAMIWQLDQSVGRIMGQVEKQGLTENTIIFFCSDNGVARQEWIDFFHSHGGLRGKKGDLLEGGIRTPMIVTWPGKIPAGRINQDAVWYFPDFLPTAADLAHAQPPSNIDGISILPMLLGKRQNLEERYLYWEFPKRDTYQQAARQGRWKVYRNRFDEPLQLYNLEADPAELYNLASQYPELIQRFEEYIKNARKESPHWPSK